MNKRKYIISGILAIIIFSVGQYVYTIIQLVPYEYNIENGFDSRFLWIFNDSIAPDLKNKYSIGNENDAIYIYDYKNSYSFLVWELGDCKNCNLSDIKITPNNWFKKITPPRTYFSYYNPNIDVEFKTKLLLSSKIGISLANGSEILNDLSTEKFRCLYGKFTKIGLRNEMEDIRATISYGSNPVNLNVIFYKARDSFFIIVISAMGKASLNDEAYRLVKLD